MWRSLILRGLRAAAAAATHRARPLSSSFATVAGGRRVVALWGNGDYGRLGLGSLESRWRPSICNFFTDEDDCPIAVACGGAHTLFLTEKGRVYASGLNNFGQLGVPSASSHALGLLEIAGLNKNVVQIAAGYYHSAAVTDDGELFMWGNNANGQLGLGKGSASVISNPTKVDSLVGFHVKMVALGSEHSIAVTDGGDVLSWGLGSGGRLGHGQQSGIFIRTSSEYVPRLIKTFEGVKVEKIAAGFLHSACIDERGSLYIFGDRIADKFGFNKTNDASIPHAIQELPFSKEVACGGYHTCAIASDGALYAWGTNENGCLGLGSTGMVRSPERVESLLFRFPVSEVSCGWKHTIVISGGVIFAWGWGGASGTFFEEGHSSGGQLGLGNDIDCKEPCSVDLGMDCEALQVSCGFNHSAAILECTGSSQ